MTVKLGMIMDPIQTINFHKDSSFAILLAAQQYGWQLYYFEQTDLFLLNNKAQGYAKQLKVYEDENHWFDTIAQQTMALGELDVILMRKDPPMDDEFIFTTYLLENAAAQGTLVYNKPQSLRDANEKFFIQWFPQCIPESLITNDKKLILDFLNKHKKIVLKPLNQMAGQSVFSLQEGEVNTHVIIENLTKNELKKIMVQRFIPEIFNQGDKRIFLIDGEPIPHTLIRKPHHDDFRGNLAVGGIASGGKLSNHDKWLCDQIAPVLKEKELLCVGLDVIGDYVTEINVTSPTGMRQIKNFSNFDIPALLINTLAKKLEITKKN